MEVRGRWLKLVQLDTCDGHTVGEVAALCRISPSASPAHLSGEKETLVPLARWLDAVPPHTCLTILSCWAVTHLGLDPGATRVCIHPHQTWYMWMSPIDLPIDPLTPWILVHHS